MNLQVLQTVPMTVHSGSFSLLLLHLCVLCVFLQKISCVTLLNIPQHHWLGIVEFWDFSVTSCFALCQLSPWKGGGRKLVTAGCPAVESLEVKPWPTGRWHTWVSKYQPIWQEGYLFFPWSCCYLNKASEVWRATVKWRCFLPLWQLQQTSAFVQKQEEPTSQQN